ncbi:hypothetical protein FIBSPDRAFT_850379 [Athelia psychrophila]|uniref:Uncharacterized protein n=1 Tax=Athelia psychrophila TaxID=1759441 RepID=A0A166TDN4_9AGAM|nr:hypothetical protein FIBSPDRAFT_850379 [Fibularhizoctonia sp. CBS 109695]
MCAYSGSYGTEKHALARAPGPGSFNRRHVCDVPPRLHPSPPNFVRYIIEHTSPHWKGWHIYGHMWMCQIWVFWVIEGIASAGLMRELACPRDVHEKVILHAAKMLVSERGGSQSLIVCILLQIVNDLWRYACTNCQDVLATGAVLSTAETCVNTNTTWVSIVQPTIQLLKAG